MSALESVDHRVPSGREGLNLLVRNKRPADLGKVGPERTVLFVHGATYASSITFDYPVDGTSWMDRLAAAGFDVWCVDLLGYGGSDRPPEMDRPAADNAPLTDTAEAEADVVRAIDFIRQRTGVERLSLIGYSWGTAIGGGVASRHPELIERLVLSGVLWLRVGGGQVAAGGIPGAYREVDAEAATKRWTVTLSAAQKDAVVPAGFVEQWAADAIASDPKSGESDPPRLRAPAGVVKDVIEHWSVDKPTYDPAAIRAPTLCVVGEWDRETVPEKGLEVFNLLENAADRRYVVVGRATHTLLLENNRLALHRTVEGFLKEGWGG
ncbi:MAG: alpha/beta fold hydrolase [Alphaproteobacteria bacterium]